MYDRPAEQVHDYAHKYRSDVPIKASEAVINNEASVPTLKIDYHTLNFGEATDSKSSEETRADAWTVGNHMTIIPPCDPDSKLREWWLRSLSPLPADDMVYKEKMAFADGHEIVVQDFVRPGGDSGDIDAAGAEQDMAATDKTRETNTSFAETHVVCKPSYFEDEERDIREEHRPMMECPLCKPEPTRTQVAVHETRKFSSMTAHTLNGHNCVVYPNSRGYTYQQLVGGKQLLTGRTWMTSATEEQRKEILTDDRVPGLREK